MTSRPVHASMGSTTVATSTRCCCRHVRGLQGSHRRHAHVMELSTRWRLELTWRTFFSTSVTALALSTLMRLQTDRYCGFISSSGSTQHTPTTSAHPTWSPVYYHLCRADGPCWRCMWLWCRPSSCASWSKYKRLFLEVHCDVAEAAHEKRTKTPTLSR
jgi:hypothetical protein